MLLLLSGGVGDEDGVDERVTSDDSTGVTGFEVEGGGRTVRLAWR